MPVSKHRKNHKTKLCQRKAKIQKQKEQYNTFIKKKMEIYSEQIARQEFENNNKIEDIEDIEVVEVIENNIPNNEIK